MRLLITSLLFVASMFGQTKNDLFVMAGSSFFRPGLAAKSSFNIGYGYLPDKLKGNKFINELTVGYTYENCGSGFWPTGNGGCHTPAVGVMRNFDVHPKLTIYGCKPVRRASQAEKMWRGDSILATAPERYISYHTTIPSGRK
jgi:hypothetical protein